MARPTSPPTQAKRTSTRDEHRAMAGMAPAWPAVFGRMPAVAAIVLWIRIGVTIGSGRSWSRLGLMGLRHVAAREKAGAGNGRARLVIGGLGLLAAVFLVTLGAVAQAQPQPQPTQLPPTGVVASAAARDSLEGDRLTPVSYEAERVIDGKENTAWRVEGDGVGQSLTFSFGRRVHLSKIGLIPGYAKTDPFDGSDRFKENRRVAAATFTFDNGDPVRVTFRDTRELQWFAVDADAASVVLKITGSTRKTERAKKTGRDFTAISEARFAGWPIDQPAPANPLRWVGYVLVAAVGLAVGVVVILAALAVVMSARRRPERAAGGRQPQSAPTAPLPPIVSPGGPPEDRPREVRRASDVQRPPGSTSSLKHRVVDNLAVTLTALLGFITASVLAPLRQLHPAWLVIAAVFAVGWVLATLSLLLSETPSTRQKQLAGGLAVCALLVLVPGWVLRPRPPPPPPPPNYDLNQPADLVLLDTSQAMSEPFENGTKLDAAVGSITDEDKTLSAQVGLATYGVEECTSGSPYQLFMPINRDGRDKLPGVLTPLTREGPRGRSNLEVAARRALQELEPFKEGRKRLLIFTGVVDGCNGNLRKVIEDAKAHEIDVEWDIVGLGHDPGIQPSDGVKVFNVQTQAQLDKLVHQLLVLDPATEEIDDLEAALNTIRDDLNAARPALNARDVTQMETASGKLRQDVAEGEKRFTGRLWDPAVRQGSGAVAECSRVADFEQKQLGRLKELVRHLAAVLQIDRDHPRDLSDDLLRERNGHVEAWETTVAEHNADKETLEERVDACLDALA